VDALVDVGARRDQRCRAAMQPLAKFFHAQQARMRNREERWQSQRTA
jgi:hypothetical protein